MYQITCETLIEGDGYIRDRVVYSRLPNTYETLACARAFARRRADEVAGYADDIFRVVFAGTWTRAPLPVVVADLECPF